MEDKDKIIATLRKQRQVSRFYRDHEFASSFPRIKGMQEALFGKANGRGCFQVPE